MTRHLGAEAKVPENAGQPGCAGIRPSGCTDLSWQEAAERRTVRWSLRRTHAKTLLKRERREGRQAGRKERAKEKGEREMNA